MHLLSTRHVTVEDLVPTLVVLAAAAVLSGAVWCLGQLQARAAGDGFTVRLWWPTDRVVREGLTGHTEWITMSCVTHQPSTTTESRLGDRQISRSATGR